MRLRTEVMTGLVSVAVSCSAAAASVDAVRNQNWPLMVQNKSLGNEEHRKSGPEIKTLDQFVRTIHACWRPPGRGEAPQDIMVTVRLAFTRDGEVFGKPTVTYITPGTSADHEFAYRKAVAETFLRCTPMNFNKGLGNAIAGRPFTFTFGNERNRNRAEPIQWPIPKIL